MSLLHKLTTILVTTTIVLQLLVSVEAQTVTVGGPCNKTAQCSSTCGKIIYCENEKIPNEGVDCPASHPYCVTDVRADRCSNKPDPARPECSTPQSDFFCTDVGYFPDPTNCRNYFICSYDPIQNDIIPHSYTCPPSHIFNFNRNNECYRYNNPPLSYCPNITCDGQETSYAVVHPRDPSYYYFCMPHPMKPSDVNIPVMFRCEPGWTFNGRNCVYNCGREGRFRVPGSDTKYYECNNVNGRLEVSFEQCPSGYSFVESYGICQVQ